MACGRVGAAYEEEGRDVGCMREGVRGRWSTYKDDKPLANGSLFGDRKERSEKG